MITEDRVNRLQVLWSKHRTYFQSFLSELGEVRKDIGDDQQFARWCISELHTSIGVIINNANILKKTDADIAKASLKKVREAERADKETRRAARKPKPAPGERRQTTPGDFSVSDYAAEHGLDPRALRRRLRAAGHTAPYTLADVEALG